MAYSSVRGRKPIERASKISHAEIISSPEVQSFLKGCALPAPGDPKTVTNAIVPVPTPKTNSVRAVIAIDGGFRETPVREEFPSASITFFTFGPLLFSLEDLRDLDEQPFIAPEDLAKLKRIQRYTLVLPTKNVTLAGLSLHRSVRQTLHDFLLKKPSDDPPLVDALRWLLFRGWTTAGTKVWTLPRCPNSGCTREGIELTPRSGDETTCLECGGPIYLVDAMRLHERVDEELGAAGILAYVMTTLEQLVLVAIVKTVWELKPKLLSEVLFIKDGPLAFFGQTAPLSRPMRELALFLESQAPSPNGAWKGSLLNAVGLEKSGAFVEHAIQIQDRLNPNSALVLTNDYIYKYVIPGDPENPDPYGKNTYWGGKLIYKAGDGNVYVATIPTGAYNPSPTAEDFANLPQILDVVGSLRCSMYDNALIPIALVNKLVSLSDFPSARILEAFAKGAIS
jgi:hypothetical protein